MTDLLIHSMSEFADIILGCLSRAGARRIAEIGAEFGGMSQRLAGYAAEVDGSLDSVDPCPKPEFLAWVADCPQVRHHAAQSLEAMPGLADIDAWLIDGDHNYYTVSNELRIADAVSARDGKPLLAILHDVGWPCARRDFYYAPERIPETDRHAYSFEAGVTPGQPGAVAGRGFRGGGYMALALQEGGERNGVLTAVEDFVAAARTPDRPLAWAFIPAVFGLGILFDASAPWAADVAALVHPYHDNALIAALERNRLSNYLAVIEWQDRQAG